MSKWTDFRILITEKLFWLALHVVPKDAILSKGIALIFKKYVDEIEEYWSKTD